MPEQTVVTDGSNLALATQTRMALDAFANGLARLGHGTASLTEGTQYPLTRFSRNYILMQSLYRSNWIARKIIDCPIEDMLKTFPRLKCTVTPQQDDQFQRVVRATKTLPKLIEAGKWGSLFGGAIAIPIIAGHEDLLEEPLDVNDIELSAYRGLIVFDRWSGVTPSADVCEDITNPLEYGLPQHYQITTDTGVMFKVHHSRVMRFTGRQLPNWERQAEMGWGISEYELVIEELKKRDNTSWSIVNLMFRANIMALNMPQLAQQMAMPNSPQFASALATLQAQNEVMSNQGMLILPENGKLESHAYSFGGVADVYTTFMLDICGCAEMSMSKLFGRSATGLGATNGDDQMMYEQGCEQKRNQRFTPVFDKLFPIIAMSTWGAIPDDLDYSYPAIRTMTEKERAELAKAIGDNVVAVYNAGIGSQKLALKELRSSSEVTGIWTNITDEMIEAASDEVMQPDLALGNGEGDGDGDRVDRTDEGNASEDSD